MRCLLLIVALLSLPLTSVAEEIHPQDKGKGKIITTWKTHKHGVRYQLRLERTGQRPPWVIELAGPLHRKRDPGLQFTVRF